MKSPHEMFREINATTRDVITAIRVIREQFGLNPREAKEVMLQAEGIAASLDEHQAQFTALVEQMMAGRDRPAEPGAAADRGNGVGLPER